MKTPIYSISAILAIAAILYMSEPVKPPVKTFISGVITNPNSDSIKVFNFGKYKNQSVSKVFKTNPEYYHWIMKSNFPIDSKNKFTEIKLRDINK